MITALSLSPALDVTYLVPTVAVGAIHRPSEVLRFAGGKGLNVARAAARLGAEVRVVAPLGGHIGALVESLADGITVVAVPVAAETRSCVTVAAEGSLTEFYEPAPALSADELAAFVVAVAALPVDGWTVFSGSIPAGLDVSALVTVLRERHPLAIDSHGPALAVLVDELRPELVKLNRHEASELLGMDAAALELAQQLRARSGGTVIVTDGSDGSAAVDVTGSWRVNSHAQPGVFPVGSGDTFLAGIVTALGRGEGLAEALMLASTSAAANAAVPGAADFDPALALELRSQTTVSPL